MLTPDTGRRLPPGWRPPTPFPVVVRYIRGRRNDPLWTTPWLVDGEGKVVLYMACGPVGKPAGMHLISHVDMRTMLRGAKVQVVVERDQAGRVVYAAPDHTPN